MLLSHSGAGESAIAVHTTTSDGEKCVEFRQIIMDPEDNASVQTPLAPEGLTGDGDVHTLTGQEDVGEVTHHQTEDNSQMHGEIGRNVYPMKS